MIFDSAIEGQLLHLLVSNDDCMIRNELGHKCASLDKIGRSTSMISEGWQSFETSPIENAWVVESRGAAAEL